MAIARFPTSQQAALTAFINRFLKRGTADTSGVDVLNGNEQQAWQLQAGGLDRLDHPHAQRHPPLGSLCELSDRGARALTSRLPCLDTGLLRAAFHRLERRFGYGCLGTLIACGGAGSEPRSQPAGAGATLQSGGGSASEPASGGVERENAGAGGVERENAGAGGVGERAPDWLLPARVRRLANVEYDGSVQALLGTEQRPASESNFPPDLRRDGFTVNAAQRVDAVIVERLADAADALATEAEQTGRSRGWLPAPAHEDATELCSSLHQHVRRRRSIAGRCSTKSRARCLLLYDVGAEGASYEDGIAHVTRGLLQSAGFLYLTELGDGSHRADGIVELTPDEIATLAFVLSDLRAARRRAAQQSSGSGALADSSRARAPGTAAVCRGADARRTTVVRLVREWLGIDRIDDSAKDSLVYPDFEAEKPRIVAESTDFVRAVAFESTGNVSELLGARWTVSSGPLALYQSAGTGPIPGSIAPRSRRHSESGGIPRDLRQAHESHPVFRGVAIAQRVACMGLDSPASFNIQVVPPLPDPTLTTRERYQRPLARTRSALAVTRSSTRSDFRSSTTTAWARIAPSSTARASTARSGCSVPETLDGQLRRQQPARGGARAE